MFYFIGIGLGDVEDITVKGLKCVKRCKRVYLDAYTSLIASSKETLETFYGIEITLADREMVEQRSDEMLDGANEHDIAFLVIGDPFGATTHSDLVLRAIDQHIPYKVIHNASIINAIGCCGLQLYNFGETVSIVFWTDEWRPTSFLDKILKNRQLGLHTLCLLDIKVKEQTIENLIKGNQVYEPPRYMSCDQAAQQIVDALITSEDSKKDSSILNTLSPLDLCVGLARVGTDTQHIVVTSLKTMGTMDLGLPLHSLIIPGTLHPLEVDMLRTFCVDDVSKNNLMKS